MATVIRSRWSNHKENHGFQNAQSEDGTKAVRAVQQKGVVHRASPGKLLLFLVSRHCLHARVWRQRGIQKVPRPVNGRGLPNALQPSRADVCNDVPTSLLRHRLYCDGE
jgi:hypothetical protein